MTGVVTSTFVALRIFASVAGDDIPMGLILIGVNDVVVGTGYCCTKLL